VYSPPAEPGKPPQIVAQFGSYGKGPGEFIYVTDVAILTDSAGYAVRFYVGEYGGNDRISIWEPRPDGSIVFVGAFGAPGDGRDAKPGEIQFDRPQSIALDQARGRLIATDSCNHRIGVFTLAGDLVRWIDAREGTPAAPPTTSATTEAAARGMDAAEALTDSDEAAMQDVGPVSEGMAYPFGLHLLDDGSVLVTEFGYHRVRHLDVETGRTLGLYGRGGRGPGELLNPWAVTMIGRTVYVLDSGNERIQAFNLPRTRLSTRSADPAGRGG
jgi:hypothetical protein